MILYLQSAAPDSTRFTVVNDGASVTGYDLLAGTSFGSPVWEHTFSGPRGTQGARPAQGRLPNREVNLIIRVSAATKDALAVAMSSLADVVDDLRRYGGTCRWKSKSQTRYQSADVLTASLELPTWDNRLEQRFRALVNVKLTCGPYMLGDPMDVVDEFTTDNVNAGDANYTADNGALTNVAVSGGRLNGAANLTQFNDLIYTGNGYTYGDNEAKVIAAPGATISGFAAGVILKWINHSNLLYIYIDDNGANSRLRIDKVVAGALTNLSSVNLGARLVNGQRFTVGGRIEGNTVFAGIQLSARLSMASDNASDANTSVVLSTAEAAIFGSGIEGKSGITFTPQTTTANIELLTIRPYTYRGAAISTADSFPFVMRGNIIGDAPAASDLVIASVAAAPQRFAMLGWMPTKIWNMLGNGGFDASDGTIVLPWNVTAVAGVTGAATSITAAALNPKFGLYAGLITTPATANVGANYPVYQRFEKGITYTATAWLKSAASTTLARIRLGVSGDIASSTAVALSTLWTQHTATWTPTATVKLAYMAVEQTAATAGTIDVDGAAVYEGAVAPTWGGHAEGDGGYPPLSVIGAADFIKNTGSLVATVDGNALSGTAMVDTSVAAAGESYELRYVIDPSLALPDDYSLSEISVEVWGRFRMSTAFTGGITVVAKAQTITEDQTVYTSEYGSTGRRLVTPSANNNLYQTSRLGTLRLRCSPRGRWLLTIAMTAAAGTNLQAFGLDSLILMPARSRVLTPSGKANTGYPDALPGVGVRAKIIASADLSGRFINNYRDFDSNSSSGMSGSAIELPAGGVTTFGVIATQVPDGDAAPTSDGMTRLAAHLAVTPRYHWLRGS